MTTPEATRPKEQPDPIPTSLRLFRFTQNELDRTLIQYNALRKLNREVPSAIHTLTESQGEIDARRNRIIENGRELDEQSDSLLDSTACGAAYIKMFDELSGEGVSDEQIMDFYLSCLRINTQTYDFVIRQRRTTRETPSEQVLKNRPVKKKLDELVEKETKSIPSWFQGDMDAWKLFVIDHALFPDYLNDFFQIYPSMYTLEKNSSFGATTKANLPDWLEEYFDNGLVPDRSLVVQELTEDLEERKNIKKQLDQLEKQEEYVRTLILQKFVKTIAWVQARKIEATPVAQNFSDFVLQIAQLHTYPEFSIDQNNSSLVDTAKQIIGSMVLPEISHERRIKTFAESKQGITSKEITALWLEKNLQEGKVIQNAQDTIDDALTNRLTQLLDEVREDGSRPEFQALRKTDKKAFNALNFDAKPLLGMLSAEEISYLQELTEISQDKPVETIIWEIAEAVSSKMKENRDPAALPRQTGIIIDHLQKFLGTWLRANWKWAFRQLTDSLHEKPQETSLNNPPAQVVDIFDSADIEETLPTEIQEITEAIQQAKEGNLAGYRLYYTIDTSINPRSLIEIEGVTLEEREKAITQFIRRRGITCTITEATIIRGLDSMLGDPEEVEWTRMRMDVNGEEYKKLKHTKLMRTLYKRDDDSKTIIFFVYKKKDRSYRDLTNKG